jgi:tetratricopeptide (TPR) repeat protein
MFKSKIQILLFLIPIAICIWMMYPLHGFVFECEYCDGLAIDLTLKFVLIIWVLYILIYTSVVFSNKEKNEKEKKHRLQRYLIMVISIIGIVGGTYSFLIYDGQQRTKVYYSKRKKEFKIEQQQIKHTIDSLKNIVNLHPNNAQVYYNLALELRHQGMWRYAKEVLIKGISIDSTSSDCHLELAYIYKVKNSNINKVISEYRLGLKYMKTDPDWVIREIEWLEELKKRKKN